MIQIWRKTERIVWAQKAAVLPIVNVERLLNTHFGMATHYICIRWKHSYKSNLIISTLHGSRAHSILVKTYDRYCNENTSTAGDTRISIKWEEQSGTLRERIMASTATTFVWGNVVSTSRRRDGLRPLLAVFFVSTAKEQSLPTWHTYAVHKLQRVSHLPPWKGCSKERCSRRAIAHTKQSKEFEHKSALVMTPPAASKRPNAGLAASARMYHPNCSGWIISCICGNAKAHWNASWLWPLCVLKLCISLAHAKWSRDMTRKSHKTKLHELAVPLNCPVLNSSNKTLLPPGGGCPVAVQMLFLLRCFTALISSRGN